MFELYVKYKVNLEEKNNWEKVDKELYHLVGDYSQISTLIKGVRFHNWYIEDFNYCSFLRKSIIKKLQGSVEISAQLKEI